MRLIPRAAVIGGGFAGLAASWYLLNLPCKPEVTLFDPNGYGGEASKTSAGILQKYGGLHAKLNRFAEEGEKATLELIEIAFSASKRSIIRSRGLLRLALQEQQKLDFMRSSTLHRDVEWLSIAECQKINPLLPNSPAIWIRSGLTIDVDAYLSGLFCACSHKGLRLVKKAVLPTDDWGNYSAVIFATGAASKSMKLFQRFHIHPLKGQLIELEWPKSIPPLPFSLLSQAYICMNKDDTRAIVGATYERDFVDSKPCPKRAFEELFPKAISLYPPLEKAQCLEVKAGLRVSTSSHLPLIEHVEKNIWIYTGLGSRGLLYHAFFAKKLVQKINERIGQECIGPECAGLEQPGLE